MSRPQITDHGAAARSAALIAAAQKKEPVAVELPTGSKTEPRYARVTAS